MLSKDIWPVAQFSRISFDTTCLYVFAENKLISSVKNTKLIQSYILNLATKPGSFTAKTVYNKFCFFSEHCWNTLIYRLKMGLSKSTFA